jgi:hypothetical protein
MKRKLIPIILTSFFFVLSLTITAQTKSPNANTPADAGTPEDPNTGGDGGALGGGAPIGGGTLILMALGAAYGGKKVYKLYQDNQEELED